MKADPETATQVLGALRRFEDAIARKDVDAALAVFAPEVMQFGSGIDEKTFDREQLRAAIERDIDQADETRFEYSWTTVWRNGPVAWHAGEGEMWWRTGDVTGSSPARLTTVWELRDGVWLCVQAHFSLPAMGQAEGQSFPTAMEAIASSVSSERPDLRAQAAPDGTVTILFTDIENSTNLTERLGDIQWLDVLRQHNAIVQGQLEGHGCFEVKSQGDGFMIASQSARRALHCAIGIQQGLAQHNEQAAEPIQVRMGLHTGEVLKDADDFFGKHVILASRIAGKARGGEILVSSLLRDLTESAGDIAFGEAREVELKGLSGVYSVYPIVWDER